jgi:phytoene dehydrogenase-like protein
MSEAPVRVVGAGLAGLGAALHLHEAGVPVEVLEASDAVGGRVRTDELDGFQLDRGFQVLLTAYPECKRLDVEKDLSLGRFDPGALVRIGGKLHKVGDPWRKPGSLLSTLRAPVGGFGDKLRLGRLRATLDKTPVDELLGMPQSSTAERLEEIGFGPAMRERFLRPFLGGIFLEDALATSSRFFHFVFKMFGEGDGAIPHGGMQRLPEQLAQRLPEGTVRCDAPVRQVGESQGQSFVVMEDGRRLESDAVILATESHRARELLGERAGSLGASPDWRGVHVVYFACDAAPRREPMLILNGQDGELVHHMAFVSRVAQGLAPEGKELLSVSVLEEDAQGDLDSLGARVQEELIAWFGEVARSWRCLSHRHVRHALPRQQPEDMAPVDKSPRITHGLYCAGDWRETASIHGALRSGRRAAEAWLTER